MTCKCEQVDDFPFKTTYSCFACKTCVITGLSHDKIATTMHLNFNTRNL